MNDIFVWKNGEKLAQKYLKKNGYKILSTNEKNQFAEVDIIAEKNNEIIFIEVKSRTNLEYGTPGEAVTIKKQQAYIRFSQQYVVKNKIADKNLRFDVIEILNGEINHIISAFDADCMKIYISK